MAATASVEAILEADERRAARDSWRAAGGSQRRPLKSFRTKAEKREARLEHAERLRDAVEHVRDAQGFAQWAEGLILNPQLTPLNAALAALQSPGMVVGTAATWRRQGGRIAKGESAAGRITGKGFWPVAYFTAEQAGAAELAELEVELPGEVELEILRGELRRCLDAGQKPRDVLPAIGEAIRELGSV